MVIGDDELEEDNIPSEENLMTNTSKEQEKEMEISIHGNTSETTLRIKPVVGGKEVIILIHTCITHNFLNSKATEHLHCTKEIDKPIQVCVVDGYKMVCNEMKV